MNLPTLSILAGPNGAGKSTYAAERFPKQLAKGQFLNADEMARELGNGHYVGQETNAARMILQKRTTLIQQQQSFIIETTLASRGLLQAVEQARKNGFQIHLHYLWISQPELCDFRVKQRVAKGGHNIELDVILRRYQKSLAYLEDYLEKADWVWIYQADMFPELILTKENGHTLIHMPELWQQMQIQIQEMRKASFKEGLFKL